MIKAQTQRLSGKRRPMTKPFGRTHPRTARVSTRASAWCTCCTMSISTSTPAQVTALVGDNGAGKSTWSRRSPASTASTPASYLFEGKPVPSAVPRTPPLSASRSSTRTSRCATTSTSWRTCSSAGRSRRASCSTRRKMESRARETLASLSVRTVKSVRQSVASLSGGQRQTVAIAKSVLWNSKVVLLDEPTAALGVAQTRQVLDLVRRLADHGLGVVLISHNMADVFEVADRITRALPRPGGGRRQGHQGRDAQAGRRADHHGAQSGDLGMPTEPPQLRSERHRSCQGPGQAHDHVKPEVAESDFAIDAQQSATFADAARGLLGTGCGRRHGLAASDSRGLIVLFDRVQLRQRPVPVHAQHGQPLHPGRVDLRPRHGPDARAAARRHRPVRRRDGRHVVPA